MAFLVPSLYRVRLKVSLHFRYKPCIVVLLGACFSGAAVTYLLILVFLGGVPCRHISSVYSLRDGRRGAKGGATRMA